MPTYRLIGTPRRTVFSVFARKLHSSRARDVPGLCGLRGWKVEESTNIMKQTREVREEQFLARRSEKEDT